MSNSNGLLRTIVSNRIENPDSRHSRHAEGCLVKINNRFLLRKIIRIGLALSEDDSNGLGIEATSLHLGKDLLDLFRNFLFLCFKDFHPFNELAKLVRDDSVTVTVVNLCHAHDRSLLFYLSNAC